MSGFRAHPILAGGRVVALQQPRPEMVTGADARTLWSADLLSRRRAPFPVAQRSGASAGTPGWSDAGRGGRARFPYLARAAADSLRRARSVQGERCRGDCGIAVGQSAGPPRVTLSEQCEAARLATCHAVDDVRGSGGRRVLGRSFVSIFRAGTGDFVDRRTLPSVGTTRMRSAAVVPVALSGQRV
jgi:hypothetical protein